MSNTNSTPQDFYVYIHRRATTGEVFYVGKGAGDRAHSHFGRGTYWQNIVKKHGVIVEIVQSGLQEWAAFEIERDLIALHGRGDCGYGPLVNLTDGGEGATGHRQTDEAKMKSRAAATAAWALQSHRKKVAEAWSNPELKARHAASVRRARATPMLKEKISKSSRGVWSRPEYRERITAAISAAWKDPDSRARRIASLSVAIRKDRAKTVICVETNRPFDTVTDAAKWLRENGWPKACPPNIVATCKGRVKAAYGYTWRYAAPA
jgi:hypothetical protein